MQDHTKERIAILGGGQGSMAAAAYLTSGPNRDKYDVTIYQRGWRLGGKGASGRNQDHHQRVEEHGLHIWLGFYENAFRLYRETFEEWKRAPDHPWKEVFGGPFKRFSYTPLFEKQDDGSWEAWDIHWPENDEVPGDGTKITIWDMLRQIRDLIRNLSHVGRAHPGHPPLHHNARITDAFSTNSKRFLGKVEKENDDIHLHAHNQIEFLHTLFEQFIGEEKELPDSVENRTKVEALIGVCDQALQILNRQDLKVVGGLRMLKLGLQFSLSLLRGLFWNLWDIHKDGLDVLDDLEFRAFLKKHGASDELLHSALVGSWYDLIFAFTKGNWQDFSSQNCAAGVAIRSYYRLGFTYKGAVFFKMQAGMGDTIFTPFYQVLKQRGVTFRFFHNVTELVPSQDGRHVAEVHLEQQATLRSGDYDPLISVKSLDCWPSKPIYDQLVQGADLQTSDELPGGGYDIESDFTQWDANLPPVTLRYQADTDPSNNIYGFEHLVFGLAVGAVADTCAQLVAIDPAMAKMVSKMETVRTQAYQLWLTRDLAGLGWENDTPIGTHFENPLNTWADMTHLIPTEDFPSGTEPQQLSYFCGPMKDESPPNSSRDVLQQSRARVEATSDSLQQELLKIWPLMTSGNGGFEQTAIMDEYFRANISASERYVLSVAGSTEARLRARGSQFKNLIFTGDWTRNNFNAGCIEAATMSGMEASNAVSSYPALDDIYCYEGP